MLLCSFHLALVAPFVLFLSTLAGAASLPESRNTEDSVGRLISWKEYAILPLDDRHGFTTFKISDGYGGDAEQKAAALFRAPFEGLDLSKVSFADFDILRTMREAVEDADVEQFVPQIAAARTNATLRQELSVGRIKNTVLRLTATIQVLEIKISKDQTFGGDTDYEEEWLYDELNTRDQLDEALAQDKANAGLPSRGVQWP
ncbi:hypothetical protein SISSUDRAFT_1116881 [Sistotremastrum suecicum HHB10207 ss-3]|uniref:Uncharacterized protein n=1 Tax=Sistotremastrum suecicum HHB10207 ss-3 TaxID=1314776 RepID=A0A166HEL2_9AGAM|nr:hypothetical protein SISSUDRAFT_1116881 [Sistotremastrum suecicum HHB10207 ss-3]